MKRCFLIAGVVAGVLSVISLTMAGERVWATIETAKAIEIVERGLDWDQTTPINVVQQADRLKANVDILRSQAADRNTWVGLSCFMGIVAWGAIFMMRRQPTSN